MVPTPKVSPIGSTPNVQIGVLEDFNSGENAAKLLLRLAA
jgi:hypothetical protein